MKIQSNYICAGYHKSFDFTIPEDLPFDEARKDAFVPSNIVESEIQKYFDINYESLRKSEYYNSERNAYLLFGLGGVSSYEITNVTSLGDMVEIEFNSYQDGEFVKSASCP